MQASLDMDLIFLRVPK